MMAFIQRHRVVLQRRRDRPLGEQSVLRQVRDLDFFLLPVGLDGADAGGETHQQDAECDLCDDQDFSDGRHHLLSNKRFD